MNAERVQRADITRLERGGFIRREVVGRRVHPVIAIGPPAPQLVIDHLLQLIPAHDITQRTGPTPNDTRRTNAQMSVWSVAEVPSNAGALQRRVVGGYGASVTTAAPTIPRRSWVALAVGTASIFLFVLDSGLLSVAFPAIEKEFAGTSRSTLSWAATGYLVALAGLLLVSGRLSDTKGRKPVYLFGVALFTIGAVATVSAPTPGLLIAARVIQGAGGAFLTSSALAMVLPLFPMERRGSVVGIWGGIGSIAAVLAPTAGAWTVQNISWRAAFSIEIPLGVATFVAGWLTLPSAAAPVASTVRINPRSALSGSIGLGLSAAVLSQGRRWGWTSRGTVGAAVVGVGLLVTFFALSKRDESPLFDFNLFGYRDWTTNTLAAGLQQIGFFTWFLTTPLILVNIWGWSVLEAGAAMALGQVASTVSGLLGGRWADRVGTTKPIVISAMVTLLGPLWLAIAATSKPNFVGVFLPATLLMGAGGGICGMLTTGGALSRLPDSVMGAANGAHQVFRRIFGLIGVAVALAVLGEAKGADLLGPARVVWLIIALAHVAMCIPLLLKPRTATAR
jgi:EmrB/QacA subfamily drug resistance transporter